MSFSCQHDRKGHCVLLDRPCEPGIKGCTLYGRFTFASPDSPSNEAVARREKTRQMRSEKEDLDPKRG